MSNVLAMRRPAAKAKAKADRGWKASHHRPGLLIRRIPGYKIVEDTYGVSYLFVLSWNPDRTKVDKTLYPMSGYLNWEALAAAGLSAIKEAA